MVSLISNGLSDGIPDGQQVMVQVVEYLVCDFAIGNGRITQASAIMQVSGVDKQQVASIPVRLVLHVLDKRVDIAPVGRVRGFLDMTLHPSLLLRSRFWSALRARL